MNFEQPIERLNRLESKVRTYEDVFVESGSEEQKSAWAEIKPGIDDLIRERKAPYIMRQIKLPIILVATPEIVSLPQNMGNLANVITTGDGGGLADISAALIKELDRRGVNVHVALPEYRHLFEECAHISSRDYDLLKSEIDDANSRIHLIEDGMFEGAKRVYNDVRDGLDKIDLRRATAFQRGIIHRLFPLIKKSHSNVLVHCNDWMTGLIPAAARSQNIKSLMTFHNIFTQFQWLKGLQKHGIHAESFWKYLYFREHPDKFGDFHGNYERNDVDFMTSGLFAADFINTVSPTFLKEIVEGYFLDHGIIPSRMREVILSRNSENCALGILNAPELTADPRADNMLVQRYWWDPSESEGLVDITSGKEANKRYLQEALGLEPDPSIPVFLWPSRIAKPQKGFELLLDLIPYLMEKFRMQIAVIANGDLSLIPGIEHWQRVYPGKVAYRSFDRKLSQIAKAGSDFLLMPSLYEPCGIPQVEAPRYGTFPIVRRTGGLADTVEQLSTNGLMGNGFVFQDFMPSGFWYAISKAMSFYNKQSMQFRLGVQKRIMKESFAKFNIQETAKRYIDVYEQIFQRTNPGIKIV
jgi:ADP-glucose type glycogen/starch synthase